MRTWTKVMAAAMLWTGAAAAQPLGVPPGRWWERPKVAEELSLQAEQRAKLDSVTLEHARTMIDLKAAVDKAELDLRVMAEGEPFDARAVRASFAALQQARLRLENERFEMLLKVREVLTAGQWARLKAMTSRLMEKVRENRRGPEGERRLQRRLP